MKSAPQPSSLSIALLPMLLALAACVHEGSGSRAAAPARSAAVPATPAATAASEPTGAASPSAPAVTPPAAPAEAQNSAAPPPPRSGPTATKVPPAKAASVARAGAAAPAAAGASTTRPAAAAPGPSAAALDLSALEQRLRDTHAIGVFTKLSLKNQVDDLLAQFKAFYGGQSQFSLAQLRQNYEVLLLKVVSVLQDGDPALSSAVSSSREAIWAVLKDPRKFAAI